MKYVEVFFLAIFLWLEHASSTSNTTLSPSHSLSPTVHPTSPNSSKPTKAITCNEITNTSCGDCAGNSQCFWCASTSRCMTYEKTIKLVPEGCKNNDWYWKQCLINGHVLMILVPSLAGGFLLFFVCGIYCCCCRSSNKRKDQREEEGYHHRREEIRMRSEERKSQRQSRYNLIRKKYGLLENEDDDDDEPMEDPRSARII